MRMLDAGMDEFLIIGFARTELLLQVVLALGNDMFGRATLEVINMSTENNLQLSNNGFRNIGIDESILIGCGFLSSNHFG